MKRNGFLSVLIVFVAVFLSGGDPAFAQKDTFSARPSTEQGSSGAKGRRTTLNFEDELVEGTNQKPDMVYLFQQKKFNYNRLIKLRENFKPEMRETVEDVQRIRSEN